MNVLYIKKKLTAPAIIDVGTSIKIILIANILMAFYLVEV